MNSVPIFVGLDYHSKSVQVCVMDADQRILANRRCGNSVADVTALIGEFGSPARLVIESCSGAADFAESLIKESGWNIALAHPGYVARMKCNPDKSDYSDARMLADLCRAGLVPRVWLAPQPVRELRVLVRFRFDQVRRKVAIKLRVAALLKEQRATEPAVGRWRKTWLTWLSSTDQISQQGRWMIEQHMRELDEICGRILAIEEQLERLTCDDPLVCKLRQIKSIGLVTACTMRAVIGRFDRFTTGKQLARFCALTPKNASSGQRQADAGLIKAGDPALKTVLIQAAQRLRMHDPRWQTLYERMRANGKPSSLAIAAVANRWVRSLHHQLKEVPAA